VTRAKRIDRALLGFRRFLREWPTVRFIIVGEVQNSYPLEELEAARDLGERLVVTGRQPMDRFYLHMLACDVVVNLRFPSTGEFSGTQIRTLGMGKPVLVSNTGPFLVLRRAGRLKEPRRRSLRVPGKLSFPASRADAGTSPASNRGLVRVERCHGSPGISFHKIAS